MSAMNVVYTHEGKLYVNVTNRCTNKCKFCIRFTPSGMDGLDLWLEHEPSVEEIKAALAAADFTSYDEVIFCGYGEPLLRWSEVAQAAEFIRKSCTAKIRINTNGHANRAAGRDITPELEGLIDVISVSLNAKNAREYNEICVCDYGEEGFYEMLDFVKCAKKHVPRVVMSVVDTIGAEDIEACRKIAEEVGAEYRVREYSE